MERALLRVRLTPRAGNNALAGWHDDVLHVHVTAPPLQNRANAALIALVARAAGVPPSSVRIALGQTGRYKRVQVDGITQADLDRRLGRGSA